MSVEEIKALMRRFIEELNKGKAAAMAVIDELYATDIVFQSGSGKDICGSKDFKQFNSDFFNAFPDIHFTIDDIVVEGDKVATRYTWTGTHTGEISGIPPTNKRVKMWTISVDRIAGGKFVEEWERYDTLDVMRQLDLIPTLGKGR